MPERVIRLPRPLPHQLDVLRSPARNKVVVWGRRRGKTAVGLIAVLEGHGTRERWHRGALEGATIFWVTKDYPTAEFIWRSLKSATQDAALSVNNTGMRVVLPGGGSVTVKSAESSLRGPSLNGVVFDETAECGVENWTEEVQPSLADQQGWAIFLGTPRGQNWFWELFQGAARWPDWARWQSGTDTSTVKQAELDAALVLVGSTVFAQEYFAEFVSPGTAIFRREHDRRYFMDGTVYRFSSTDLTDATHRDMISPFITVDTACTEESMAVRPADIRNNKNPDFTCIGAWGATRGGKLCLLDLDMRRIAAPAIAGAIIAMQEKWRAPVWIEATTQSRHLLAFLDQAGIVFRELLPGNRDKVARASFPAAGMWEQGRVVLPRDLNHEAEKQLFAFPDPAVHDDFVDCLAWAAHVFKNEMGGEARVPQVERNVQVAHEYLPAGIGVARPPGF